MSSKEVKALQAEVARNREEIDMLKQRVLKLEGGNQAMKDEL